MAASSTTSSIRRARHDPRDSEREILDAAEQILRELPYREVTIEAIMGRTGLKRPAFYTHFRDRTDIVLRVVQDIGAQFLGGADAWLSGDGESPRVLREALAGCVAVYALHGQILRALAEAAPADAGVEAAYRGMIAQLTDATSRRIAEEQQLRTIDPDLDGAETARALVWMSERYLYETLGRHSEDPQMVTGMLQRIWLAVLYGG
jgi:AcrR family transcriptional regulator